MKTAERQFTTISGVPIEPLYGPDDYRRTRYRAPPGEFPYTRGIHRDMYRGKLWTMRQFSGFATPEETNRRYHYLLEQGQTGLSVAFDLPTLMGYDADHPLSEGEVGKCGASISFARRHGDPVPRHSAGRRHGLHDHQLAGGRAVGHVPGGGGAAGRGLGARFGHPAERHSERIHRAEGIHLSRRGLPCGWSPTPSNSARATRRASIPISISGYHIREAGSTAVQELAFTLRDGIEYVDWALERGLDIDEFAPRLSFFFNAHNDFFEEIAKYRAARKIWAHAMRDRYGARERAQPEAALPRPDRGLLAHLAAAV